MNWSQNFTVKSNARRAAKKAKVDPSSVQAFVKAGETLYRFPLAAEAPKAAKAKPAKIKPKAKTPKPAKAKTGKWKSNTDFMKSFDKKPAKGAKAPAKPKGSAAARGGGKFDQVAAMLRRAGGASMTEIVAITNWKPHSARARISVDVAKLLNKGETIERRRESGVSHYAIVASKQMDLPIPDAA